MTDQPRYKLCATCHSNWAPQNERRCDACNAAAHQPPRAQRLTKPKPRTPKTSSRLDVLDLSTLPEPTPDEIDAYLAGTDQ